MRKYRYQRNILEAFEKKDWDLLCNILREVAEKKIEIIDDYFMKRYTEYASKYTVKSYESLILLLLEVPNSKEAIVKTALDKIFGGPRYYCEPKSEEELVFLENILAIARQNNIDVKSLLEEKIYFLSYNSKAKKIIILHGLRLENSESELQEKFKIAIESGRMDADFFGKVLIEARRLNFDIINFVKLCPYQHNPSLSKVLALHCLEVENLATNQELNVFFLSTFLLMLGENDFEVAGKIFSKIDKGHYYAILDDYRYDKSKLSWLAQRFLSAEIDEEFAVYLIFQLIKYNLWQDVDLVIARYSNINLSALIIYPTILQNILPRNFDEEWVKQLLVRVANVDIAIVKNLFKQLCKSYRFCEHKGQANKAIQLIIKKFPGLTINDIEDRNLNDYESPFYRLDPEIIRLLLDQTSADLIELELAQKIFDIALLDIYDLGEEGKIAKLELIKLIIQKKSPLNYDVICLKANRIGSDLLKSTLEQIPIERISEDFKANILANLIKSHDWSNLAVINDFLEKHGVVDYLKQLKALKDKDWQHCYSQKDEHCRYLIDKINLVPAQLAQNLLEELFRRSTVDTDSKDIELMQLIISKTNDNELDYNKIISGFEYHHKPEKLRFLLNKISNISQPLAQDLLEKILCNQDFELIELVVSKTDQNAVDYHQLIIKNVFTTEQKLNWLINQIKTITSQDALILLDKLLKEERDFDIGDRSMYAYYKVKNYGILLTFLLGKIEGKIDDAEMSGKILNIAICNNNQVLFELTESKLATPPDYNLALHYQIYIASIRREFTDYHETFALLLARGADLNRKYAIAGSEKYPLDFAYLSDELSRMLIKYGAKLSLIDNHHLKSQLIRRFCEDKNYQYLEQYLSELDGDQKKSAIDLIFQTSVSQNDDELLELIIRHGFDVNAELKISNINYFPLQYAVQCQGLKIIESLAKKRAHYGQGFAIYDAVCYQKNELLQILCHEGYDYNLYPERVETEIIQSNYFYYNYQKHVLHPLETAIFLRNPETVRILLNYMTEEDLANLQKTAGYSLFVAAIDILQEEKIALTLFDKKLSVIDGYNLFYKACANGMLELVKRIHQQGHVDIFKEEIIKDVYSQRIKSGLSLATDCGKAEIVNYFLDCGVKVDGSILFEAMKKDNISDDLLLKMIESLKDINYQDSLNENLLYKIIQLDKPKRDKIKLIKKLIEKGLDIYSLNPNGLSPLHFAARLGDKEIFDFLVSSGLNPLVKDNAGNNCYYYALYFNNLDNLAIPLDQFPFEIKIYNDFLEYIKIQPETKAVVNNPDIADNPIFKVSFGAMAAKFACLFSKRSELEAYVKQYNKSFISQISYLISFLEYLQRILPSYSSEEQKVSSDIIEKIFGDNAFTNNGEDLIKKLCNLKSPPHDKEPELLGIINRENDVNQILKKISDLYEDTDFSNLVVMFKMWVQLNDNDQPLHDLSIFSLPEGKWNKEVWQKLAFEHGPRLTNYLFLASIIEEKLGRAPNNIEEVELQAKAIKYRRAAENIELADLFHDHQIAEYAFDKVLDNYRQKEADYIPDILIEGQNTESIEEEIDDKSRYYLKKLPKDDLRGFILGKKTKCCQYVGAEGHNCAFHGMSSAYGGFYVIFKRPKKARCDNLQSFLEELKKSPSEKEFLESFKDKALKNKYQKLIKKIATVFSEQYQKEPSFEDIKKILAKDFETELEGEIVAQSWVWISQNNNLVLDSWERSYEEYDSLFKPFMKALANQILVENKAVKRIFIGISGQTPTNIGLSVNYTDCEQPIDYKSYRDSNFQCLIAEIVESKTSPIPSVKVNSVINISNQKRGELELHFSSEENLKILSQIQEKWRKRCEHIISNKQLTPSI